MRGKAGKAAKKVRFSEEVDIVWIESVAILQLADDAVHILRNEFDPASYNPNQPSNLLIKLIHRIISKGVIDYWYRTVMPLSTTMKLHIVNLLFHPDDFFYRRIYIGLKLDAAQQIIGSTKFLNIIMLIWKDYNSILKKTEEIKEYCRKEKWIRRCSFNPSTNLLETINQCVADGIFDSKNEVINSKINQVKISLALLARTNRYPDTFELNATLSNETIMQFLINMAKENKKFTAANIFLSQVIKENTPDKKKPELKQDSGCCLSPSAAILADPGLSKGEEDVPSRPSFFSTPLDAEQKHSNTRIEEDKQSRANTQKAEVILGGELTVRRQLGLSAGDSHPQTAGVSTIPAANI